MAQATDTGWEFQIAPIRNHRVPIEPELIVFIAESTAQKQEAINVYV